MSRATLLITRKYPPSVGGMQRYAADLVGHLEPIHDVELIAWGGEQWALPLIYPGFLARALARLGRGAVDVVHVLDGLLIPLGAALKAITGVPLVATVHGLDLLWPVAPYQALLDASLGAVDGYVAVSHHTAGLLAARGQGSGVHIIPNGVSVTATALSERPPDGPLRLLSVGRLVPRKGLAPFIEHVMPRLLRQVPEVQLDVIGDGPERERLERLLDQTGLRAAVTLHGRVVDPDLSWWYQRADLLIMPNIPIDGDAEGFGIVLIEAALHGCYAIATRLEGIPDAVRDGETGTLVGVGDWSAFSAAILASRARSRRAASAIRQAALRHYAWPNLAREYVRIYEHLGRPQP